MTALEPQREQREQWEQPAGSVGRSDQLAQLRLAVDRAWRDDVALEIWVDVTRDVAVIRLEGVLDEATGANLTEVVRGCQAEGACDFVFDTGSLRMERSGWAVLNRLREQIGAAGGRLDWDTVVRA